MFLRLPLLAATYISAVATLPIVEVLTGTNTPRELLQAVEEVEYWVTTPLAFRVQRSAVQDWHHRVELVQAAIAIVDATFSSLETADLAGVCSWYEIPHIVLGPVLHSSAHTWTYYISTPPQAIVDAVLATISYFNWTEVNLLSDPNVENSAAASILRSDNLRSYKSSVFALSDDETVQRTVGREMRLAGNRVSVMLTEAALTKKVLIAQYDKQIGGAGFGNVMPLLSSLFEDEDAAVDFTTGNLVIAEEGFSDVDSKLQYYQRLLGVAIDGICDCGETKCVRRSLDYLFPTHFREQSFVLVNFQYRKRVVVGSLRDGKLFPTSTIIFLGGVTDVPKNGKSNLQISGNFGVRNVAGISTIAPTFYRGALLALDAVNANPRLLANFHLVLFNFTAGVSIWNYQFAYENVYPVKDELGLAVISGLSSGVTTALIDTLKLWNYTGPVIGASNTVDGLSSRKRYPNFVRTILADNFITGVLVQLFKRFQWRHCAVLVTNETWGLGFRTEFSRLAASNGIEILNAEQVLPTPIPSLAFLRNYTANFLDILHSKARILVLVVNSNVFYVLDYLYELGVRAGDLEIVCNEGMSITLFTTDDEETNRRRSEVARGSIQFAPASYVGKFGKAVYDDYYQRFGIQPPVYGCFYYDTVLAIAHALDIIIRGGRDYTNSTVLMKELRASRFVGCTGTVTFDPDTNDRSPMQYYVLNAQFGPSGNVIANISAVALYDPTSTIVFRFYSDIVWCDGTTKVPRDIRESTIGCSFEDKYNQKFTKGSMLLYGICAFFALLTLVCVALMLWAWKPHSLQLLTERKEIQVQDGLVMLQVALELLQYALWGPTLDFFSGKWPLILSLLAMNANQLFDYRDGGFENIWLGASSIIALWMLMLLIVYCRLGTRLHCVPGCAAIGEISDFCIPLIGNFMFLPLITVMVEVFVCTRGVGISESKVAFTDSYLSVDCDFRCWRGAHLAMSTISAVLLLVFIPIIIIQRPAWQERQVALNIKSSIPYLALKSIVQVLIVLLEKTLQRDHSFEYSVVFLCIFLAFSIFSLRITCFGYRRTELWHTCGLLGVTWGAALRVIYCIVESRWTLGFEVLAGVGWCGICMFGIIYQRLKVPSLLYRKRGVDIARLFKFALQRATAGILISLRESFQQAGNRNTVMLADSRLPVNNGIAGFVSDHSLLTTPPSRRVNSKLIGGWNSPQESLQ